MIGSALGFIGSAFLHWRNGQRNRRAAARAVLAEMFANADRALSAESTFVFHEFLDGAWRTQLPLVAEFLSWPNLKTLVNAYDAAARAYENARDELPKIERENQLTAQRSEQSRKRICGWFLTVAGEWVKAMRALRSDAIRCRDRQGFDDDLRKIEDRLASANASRNLE